MTQDETKKEIPGAGQRSVLGAVILLIVVVLVGVFTRKHEPTPIPKSASMRSEPKAEARRVRIDASAPKPLGRAPRISSRRNVCCAS